MNDYDHVVKEVKKKRMKKKVVTPYNLLPFFHLKSHKNNICQKP
jgi:hypothetical protein